MVSTDAAPTVAIRRALPIDAVLSPLGQVTQFGRIDYPGPTAWPQYRTFGRFALVYLLRGGGRYEDARGRRQAVQAGDLIIVFPDLAHRYRPGPGGWTELFLCFAGAAFDPWLAAGALQRDRPVLRLTPIDHWRRRLEAILITADGDVSAGASPSDGTAPAAAIVEVCRTQQFLADALAAQMPAGADAWLVQAQAALAADLPPQQVANQLHMSYAAFRRRFTGRTGVSPGRYRSARLIDRACELIAAGGLSDKEIAAELGFCDAFHFSKRFKQITGQTPTRFRESLPFYRASRAPYSPNVVSGGARPVR